MRMARLAAVAAGVCALVAASAASTASTASTASPLPSALPSAAGLASVIVQPGVIHVGRAQHGPPTTAGCEQAYKVACFDPAQIRQAYHLPPLYAHGVTGKGATIVIVDSFGSPTIKNDLSVFDKAFGLPAPPRFQIIQPAGRVPAYN
ncbi:MAG TPA: hypothetical protein VIY52_34075, partial [Streptosporangiaceae bacterium]